MEPLNQRTIELPNRPLPGWAFCALMGMLLSSVVFAQTEVSGAVSGEWTAEDSPYIVVDSTWVPEDEELTIGAGVEVFFEEDQGLYVYGTVEAHGEENDSVYIRVAEDVEHWRGLNFYGRGRVEFDYTSIICPDTAFVLDEGYSLTMNHCVLDAGSHTFAGGDYYGVRGCNFVITHSSIRGGDFVAMSGGTMRAANSRFDFGNGPQENEPGFSALGTGFRLSDCEVIGGLRQHEMGYTIVDNCRFIQPEDSG